MTLLSPNVDLKAAGSDVLRALSTQLLQDELRKRQEDITPTRPACGSGSNRKGYNTSAHVFALFLILILSTLACAFPLAVRRFPRLPVPHKFLFISRHFGTGVLIATAFVHLLPTAFNSLTDPCLPPFWTDGYPAMAGFVAMSSVLVVVGVEMTFAIRGAGHVHGGDYDILDDSNMALRNENEPYRQNTNHSQEAALYHDVDNGENDTSSSQIPRSPRIDKPLPPPPSEDRQVFDQHEDEQESDDDLLEDGDEMTKPLKGRVDPDYDEYSRPRQNHGAYESLPENSNTTTNFTMTKPDASHEGKRLLLQCLLLEAGILFHSVFIGMALSVAVGTPFVVLLIAISFHQTFEGLALGARIAAIPESVFSSSSSPSSSPKPWLMTLAYGTTTPIGQAIGLLVHNLYDPESEMGLLMVGFMNAISSGLLLFAGLVELLAEDFLAEKSYETLRGKKRIEACGAVVGGSLLMALVGAFA